MGGRRGGPSRVFATVMILSFIRWSFLRGSYERLRPPGEGNKRYIHVVCPNGCGNQAWETRYSLDTVKTCRHDGVRVPMVRCEDEECLAKPEHRRPS